ncbi:hypothetical protein [Vibrio sp. 1180_3]|uniref:hypothetical protein n=1 Tax=Vibrio sp. 1180_3 TaxID=2528832 RepID=UPI0024076392|nr:hypothetical protein [Vibrio sp. 1180_3]MDF9399204.1 hypothetical protein [Vibrio sp. 1180_3]
MARDCELCGGSKPIGKYFTEPAEDCVSDWWRVCKNCAEMVEGQGYEVHYYKAHLKKTGKTPLTTEQRECSHEWIKHSMVTLEGGYDWVKCQRCGCFGKRYGVGQYGITELQTTRPISNY